MKRIIAAAITVVFAIALVGSGAWPLQNSGATGSGIPEPITIGGYPYDAAALIYIAADQGFFTGNGLNVTMRDYNSAPSAINGVLNDEVDIGLSSEYVIVGKAFNKENINVIGCIDKYQIAYLIGRKDRGIKNVSDLKGKKIGISRGGTQEFYLGRFLDLHDISLQDVTIVNLPSSQYVQALTNGSVDALITGIYIDQIRERLGSNVALWSVQNHQDSYFVMSCKGGWIASHRDQINRLLRSLAQSEEYTINHPAKAKTIVQKRLNYTDAYIATVWPGHRFSLSLDQSLVTVMEDEGRWMIKNNLTTEKKIPDFRNYIYPEGLEAVKPEASNIW
jgi:NitT/TauT family transport system substrate-binding protein